MKFKKKSKKSLTEKPPKLNLWGNMMWIKSYTYQNIIVNAFMYVSHFEEDKE